MNVSRTLFIGLALIAALALGTAAGYIAGHKAGRTDGENDVEAEAKHHYVETTALVREACATGSKLRSAYTKRIIGHAERCHAGTVKSAGDHFEQTSSLLTTICIDVRKATHTAHLPEARCTR